MIRKVVATFLVKVNAWGFPFPRWISDRIVHIDSRERAAKATKDIFGGLSLKWDARGAWLVDPMPSEADLAFYYSQIYWSTRWENNSWLRTRDIDHFLMLEDCIKSRLSDRLRTAVNFGSGHGGCSFLFRAAGLKVWNIDHRSTSSFFVNSADAIEDVPEPIDLVYASHSLEHVTDPFEVVGSLVDRLTDRGLLFVEVPNGRRADELRSGPTGSQIPPLHAPHTVYFTTDFFRQLDLDVLILDTYSYQDGDQAVPTRTDSDEVIRFLGQKRTQC